MKILVKKKHTVLAALVLFLGLAVLANWYFTKPENALPTDNVTDVDSSNVSGANLGDAIYVNSDSESQEYFADARLERDESYDKVVATLREIIESDNADSDSKKSATDKMTDMSDRKIAQSNIENLIRAKIKSDCVTVINDDGVEVIVDNSVLSEQSVLQIKEIVIENTEFSAEKISIIGAK